jgi:hypothetical protein
MYQLVQEPSVPIVLSRSDYNGSMATMNLTQIGEQTKIEIAERDVLGRINVLLYSNGKGNASSVYVDGFLYDDWTYMPSEKILNLTLDFTSNSAFEVEVTYAHSGVHLDPATTLGVGAIAVAGMCVFLVWFHRRRTKSRSGSAVSQIEV